MYFKKWCYHYYYLLLLLLVLNIDIYIYMYYYCYYMWLLLLWLLSLISIIIIIFAMIIIYIYIFIYIYICYCYYVKDLSSENLSWQWKISQLISAAYSWFSPSKILMFFRNVWLAESNETAKTTEGTQQTHSQQCCRSKNLKPHLYSRVQMFNMYPK